MTSQGECPKPKCMSPSVIGLSDPNSSTKSSSNAGLIGGLVGGLLGGALLFGCIGFYFVKRKNKKDSVPQALRRAVNNNSAMTPRQEEMAQSTHSRITSGIIPVAFSPNETNTNDTHERNTNNTPERHSKDTPEGHSKDTPERHSNDTHERHTSVSTYESSYREEIESNSRRASVESNHELQHKATVVQATQVMRAKPQIMRVNTVKIQDGLTRSASYKKTLKPEREDPFDDKNKAASINESNKAASISESNKAASISESNKPTSEPKKTFITESNNSSSSKPTDSFVSSTGGGDGEITVVWNGS